MFASEVMKAGGELDFEAMKLPQLKEELAARGSSRSGLKANLQRRLHGLLVESAIAMAIARRAEAAAEDGIGDESRGRGTESQSAPPAKRARGARTAVP
jgi:hypothetical protein